MKPLSIYIHIPFCMSKCFYCDFNSCIAEDNFKKQYLEDLISETKLYSHSLTQYEISTVFIGGGTPTSLSDDDFEKMLSFFYSQFFANNSEIFTINSQLQERFFSPEHFSSQSDSPESSAEISNNKKNPVIEYTVEANPNSLSASKVGAMKKYKINRVSLGMQSSDEKELSIIGRTHSSEDVKKAVSLLKENGINDINIDLMYAIPSQTMESFSKSLDYAIALSPTHISCYSLILEEGTRLHELYTQGKLHLPSEDEDIAMYEMAVEKLHNSGYIQYEISNFSKPGFECRHNIAYWDLKDYLGLGLSAHSYMQNIRFSNTEGIQDYHLMISENKKPVTDDEYIDLSKSFDEWIFLKLRMIKGISVQSINKNFDIDFLNQYAVQLGGLKSEGLLEYDSVRVYLTLKGFELSNYVFLTLLS